MDKSKIESLADLFWIGWILALLIIILDYNTNNYQTSLINTCVRLIAVMFIVYSQYCHGNGKELITTGPYRYTRHPIYTGFLLADITLFQSAVPLTDKLFYAVQIIFLACIIGCAYLEELVVLAKYGSEAQEYYSKTPRLFFLYPFCKH